MFYVPIAIENYTPVVLTKYPRQDSNLQTWCLKPIWLPITSPGHKINCVAIVTLYEPFGTIYQVTELRFELRRTGSEPVMLPLHYSVICKFYLLGLSALNPLSEGGTKVDDPPFPSLSILTSFSMLSTLIFKPATS